MLRRLLAPLFVVFSLLTASCTPAAGPGLQMANTVAMGVACGIAAANGTPCTPQQVLVEITQAQKEIMQALAAEAAKKSDPAVVAAMMKGLEANTAAQRELAEQVIRLAVQTPAAAPSAPAPTTTGPPETPAAPSVAPSSTPTATPAPAPSAPSSP